jgi:hypothetical protein
MRRDKTSSKIKKVCAFFPSYYRLFYFKKNIVSKAGNLEFSTV